MDCETDAGPRPPSPFLKLADLMARWDLSEKEVIDLVRRRGVPFIRMTSAIGRVKWDKVRFSLPDLEAWERANLERFNGEPVLAVLPRPGHDAGGEKDGRRPKSLLGNWREPGPPRRKRAGGAGRPD